jgi:hypothetical protein
VQQSTGHPVDRSLWNGPLPGEIDNSCNAAHAFYSSISKISDSLIASTI